MLPASTPAPFSPFTKQPLKISDSGVQNSIMVSHLMPPIMLTLMTLPFTHFILDTGSSSCLGNSDRTAPALSPFYLLILLFSTLLSRQLQGCHLPSFRPFAYIDISLRPSFPDVQQAPTPICCCQFFPQHL